MKQTQQILLLLLMAVLIITSNVLGASTVVVNINNTLASGKVTLNATVSNQKPTQGYNCSFIMWSPSTANSSSAVELATDIANTSARSTWTEFNFGVLVLEDSNDYFLGANCTNGTAISVINSTGITVQMTTPDAPSISPVDNTLVTTAGAQTFSGTVTDAKTTGCTYTIARGGASSGSDYYSGTATYLASTCSFSKTFSDSLDNGIWHTTFTASDGTDTASASTTMNVQLVGLGGFNPEISQKSGTSTNSNMIIWIILGGVLVGYFLLKKKK